MRDSPPVTIVIVTYRNLELLKQGLDSVFKTDYPQYDVVVVVNSNEDGSLDYLMGLRASHPHLTIVDAGGNIGHAAGFNVGVQHARGEYIAKLDDDTFVEQNWLRELVRAVDGDDSIAEAQSKIIHASSPESERGDSVNIALVDRCGVTSKVKSTKSTAEIFFASTCAMIIRRSLYLRAGGLDELFFVYIDEVDLAWRLRLMGYRNIIVPTSVVHHLGRTTLRRDRPWSIYLFRKNHLAMLIKNYNALNLFYYGTFFLFLMWGEAFYRVLADKSLVFVGACAQAVAWNSRNIRYLLRKRREVRRLRIVPDSTIHQAMIDVSIPWHFLQS